MSERLVKVNSLLQKEISQFFAEEVPHVFVTVTKVDTSPDLKEATVWVSFLSNAGSNLEELKSSLRELSKRLRPRLRLKSIPFFTLKIDTGIQYASEISQIVDENSPNQK